MEYKAIHRYADMSPRKIRPFAALIRHRPADEALELLRFLHNKSAACWSSAQERLGNAEDRGARDIEDLIVSESRVDGGPIMKRIMPPRSPHRVSDQTALFAHSCGVVGRRARGGTGDGIGGRDEVRESRASSFPRSAWERKSATLCVASGNLAGRDAERPNARSHAERGNEELILWVKKSGRPAFARNLRRLAEYLVRQQAGLLRPARGKFQDSQVRQKALRRTHSKIRIERTREKVVVYVHSGRVGMIIGKKGAEVDKLTKELEDLTHRHIEVKTVEVNRPEVDPQLVAESIGEQLAKRSSSAAP